MKRIKIKQIALLVDMVDDNENLKQGDSVILDEIIRITDVVYLGNSFLPLSKANNHIFVKDTSGFNFMGEKITKVIGYEKMEDFLENTISSKDLLECVAPKPRPTTKEEKELLYKFITKDKEITEEKMLDLFEFSNLISYDLTDTHILVFENRCEIVHFTNGTSTVDSGMSRYAIRHGIVYPYNDDDDFDSLDEDISEIKNLL